jgi:hypothetical protein
VNPSTPSSSFIVHVSLVACCFEIFVSGEAVFLDWSRIQRPIDDTRKIQAAEKNNGLTDLEAISFTSAFPRCSGDVESVSRSALEGNGVPITSLDLGSRAEPSRDPSTGSPALNGAVVID